MRNFRRICAAGLAALCLCLALGIPTGADGRETADTYQTERGGGASVGYYAGWASYQGYTPDQIPAEHLTHINYAFARIDPDTLTLELEDPAHGKKNLSALRKLREEHPGLKLLISVGGWSDSQYFSDAASTASRRERFAESCVAFVEEQRLDGVDLDWEYPVSGGAAGTIHRPEDRENFTKLLRELRTRLDRQGRRDGKDYSLTIAGAAGSWYLEQIEAVKVADIVDHIFLMGYDLHGPWEKYADFNAPLYAPSGDSPQSRTGVAASVEAYLKKGVPAEKIVLGMPLYGYVYQGVSGKDGGLYSTYTSAKSVSYKALKRSYLSNAAYRQLQHEEAQVPYLYGNRTFLSYDDETSLAAKAGLARELGLGGIGFWEISQDDGGTLMAAAGAAFRSGAGKTPFADVPAGAWYEDAAAFVYEAGLMQGTSGTAFSPDRITTRGQIAAILHRLEGEPGAGAAPFSDVTPESYCAAAAAWAAEEGIVLGYGDGTFRPDVPITRQQLAAILFRYMVHRGADTSGRADLTDFRDSGNAAAYAREPLAWAVSAGLLQGRSGGILDPYGSATRAQTAVLLQRLDGLLEES